MAERITRHLLVEQGFDWLLEANFLCQFDAPSQEALLALMEWRHTERGGVLVQIGQMDHGMDLLVQGQAVVLVPAAGAAHPVAQQPGAQESVIARLLPGHVYGERSALYQAPANATVRAVSPVKSLHMAGPQFALALRGLPALRNYLEDLVALRDRTALLSDLLLRHPFLRLLGRDDIQRFIEAGKILRVRAGQSVVRTGENTRDVYVVVKGRVGVFSGDGPSRELLASKGPGWLFGHAAALLETARTADIDALEPTELLQVSDRALMSIIHRNPALYRQLYQELAVTGVRLDHNMEAKDGLVIAVYGTGANLGTTTLGYALAASLADEGPVTLVDLALQRTARSTLQCKLAPVQVGLIACEELVTPADRHWPFRALRPLDIDQLPGLLQTLEVEVGRQGYVIVVTNSRDALNRKVLDQAESVVFVRSSLEGSHEEAATRHQYRVDAIRLQGGVLSMESSQRAVRIPADDGAVSRFKATADLSALTGDSPLGRASHRLKRALLGRSVGLALGGGGALGFAHIGLMRQLARRNIPVDYVAGVSFGSLVAGAYAVGGLPALEDLVRDRHSLIPPLMAGFASTAPFAWWVDKRYGKIAMSDTEIPFFPVGVDVNTGREVIRATGTIGDGVRSSSCLPGAYPSLSMGGQRVVDGGIYNNVPASVAWEAGAHFIIASNIIPEFPFASEPNGPVGRISRKVLGRVDDLMRSLFLLMSQSGRDRAQLADYVFDLELTGYNVYDFARGDRIAAAAEAQVEPVLNDIERAWRTRGFGLQGATAPTADHQAANVTMLTDLPPTVPSGELLHSQPESSGPRKRTSRKRT
jgi:predicted acylesterase/phospholipase RssA/CRP-like cAMP-binding protein